MRVLSQILWVCLCLRVPFLRWLKKKTGIGRIQGLHPQAEPSPRKQVAWREELGRTIFGDADVGKVGATLVWVCLFSGGSPSQKKQRKRRSSHWLLFTTANKGSPQKERHSCPLCVILLRNPCWLDTKRQACPFTLFGGGFPY